ncbi:STM4012 family radical SAM protein [Sulfidibacter corallicola]|uniref:STM4012 family radical SAM protein n=1 Tax=Sulfidibacter corallicola TaxID=2818388 RepID=A0A8A4TJL1_SULCO|nr:STM4012 family radical SAM protein [Sulfidibacter corallicola]QTD50219.1 STM4012 family radical SAM protein [Sulfidibacter corallicola]
MNLKERLRGSKYQGYAYTYPHKSAYRPFAPLDLDHVWREEDRRALFLYIHVPFCEMRCGFCNLFTYANPKERMVDQYLRTLAVQAGTVRDALGGSARFARLAVGGGTPTFLEVADLERLFRIIASFDIPLDRVPISFEMSPGTLTRDKVAVLEDHGVDRVSIGIQSFIERETKTLGRPQPPAEARRALALLREGSFPTLNIDLIYGIHGQTEASWLASLEAALAFAPEELYLYPLYVRPRTGIAGRHELIVSDHAFGLYRLAVQFLAEAGYRRASMRLFRRHDQDHAPGPIYCCQEDGMVGLGPGARSYTRTLHYCTEYAVTRPGVKAILSDYLRREAADFARVDYGFKLSREERLRRYVIKSVGHAGGLDLGACRAWSDMEAMAALPLLGEATALGLLERVGDRLVPTSSGFDHGDVLAPALYSEAVRQLMEAYEFA